jgi:hypothetical protein
VRITREADQQQGLVPHILEAIAHGVEYEHEIVPEQWLGFVLSRAPGALDATHRRADQP